MHFGDKFGQICRAERIVTNIGADDLGAKLDEIIVSPSDYAREIVHIRAFQC
jgi:hypothetical protein